MEEASGPGQHYGPRNLMERLRGALNGAGLAGKQVSPADLAPLDQFHTRGLAATVELAEAAAITRGASVIDIGSGLGGPSRYLAATYDCHVQGVDLSPAFVEAAAFLAERAGLADRVSYRCADALALPFEDGRFDLAWTQHVAMNIADRARLYSEVHRVLRSGGRFAIYDVVAASGAPLHYPVPWSRGPETSFLMTATAMRAALLERGFRIVSWTDRTEAGAAWFQEQRKARAEEGVPIVPILGLHLAMGPEFPVMAANLGRNLIEGRVGIVEAVLDRP